MPSPEKSLVPSFAPPPAAAAKDHVPAIFVPRDWGELPTSAKWEDEVEWVHQNYTRVITRTKTGNKINLRDAGSPAPSHGALGLLQHGATNPHGFYRDILLKAKGKSTAGEESDEIKQEKRSIEEIDRMLAKIQQSLGDKEQERINMEILETI